MLSGLPNCLPGYVLCYAVLWLSRYRGSYRRGTTGQGRARWGGIAKESGIWGVLWCSVLGRIDACVGTYLGR